MSSDKSGTEVLAEFFGVSEEEVLDSYAPKRHLSMHKRGYPEPITWGQMFKMQEDAEEIRALQLEKVPQPPTSVDG